MAIAHLLLDQHFLAVWFTLLGLMAVALAALHLALRPGR